MRQTLARPAGRARRALVASLAAVALMGTAACSGTADGATFPTRPLELVNPWPAGGSHDAHARAIAAEMRDVVGQPVNVTIREGGGGAVGAAHVAAQAKPDGYSMLLGDQSSVIIRPMLEQLPYSWEDLTPVAQINESPILFVVPADRPWNTLAELEAAAEADPGEVAYGSVTGLGPDQVPVAMWLRDSGLDLRHVPFEGGGATYRAVLAGDIDMAPLFPATVVKDIAEGRLKAIAVSSPERLESLPDVPTLAESGYDIEWAMFRTVFVPDETPEETVTALADAFVALADDEGFQQIVSGLGESVDVVTGQELTDRVARDANNLDDLVASLSSS